ARVVVALFVPDEALLVVEEREQALGPRGLRGGAAQRRLREGGERVEPRDTALDVERGVLLGGDPERGARGVEARRGEPRELGEALARIPEPAAHRTPGGASRRSGSRRRSARRCAWIQSPYATSEPTTTA